MSTRMTDSSGLRPERTLMAVDATPHLEETRRKLLWLLLWGALIAAALTLLSFHPGGSTKLSAPAAQQQLAYDLKALAEAPIAQVSADSRLVKVKVTVDDGDQRFQFRHRLGETAGAAAPDAAGSKQAGYIWNGLSET